VQVCRTLRCVVIDVVSPDHGIAAPLLADTPRTWVWLPNPHGVRRPPWPIYLAAGEAAHSAHLAENLSRPLGGPTPMGGPEYRNMRGETDAKTACGEARPLVQEASHVCQSEVPVRTEDPVF